ncbi:hypothetical protein [Nocardia alni]|uniref:hypothetical protein n=1 Tax=Nocardia alni TaxID=2815723 RepID=UPI001C219827|nr:hypothetical protein [Nocardia alni]
MDGAGPAWGEDEYVEYLEGERLCFAWVMQRYGGLPAARARADALELYPYEAADEPYRGMIFHDLAWHYAMERIHGREYAIEHPELRNPPAEYSALW